MQTGVPQNVEETQALLEELNGALLYPRSVQQAGGEVLCYAKDAHQHYMAAIFNPQLPPFLRDTFSGETQDLSETLAVKWCLPSHSNAKKLRALFPWTAPHPLSTTPTLPVRDLIGLAAPALLQAHAAKDYDFALALEAAPEQLSLLSRTMDEALDAATFAVFQENYRRPWAMRASDLADTEDQEFHQKLGYTEFAFVEDETDFFPGESQAWIDAALLTVAQAAPDLFAEIEATSTDFSEWWVAKTDAGGWRLRDRVYRLLLNNEATHYAFIHVAAERLFDAFQNDPLRNE